MTALGIRYLTGCSVSSDMARQPEFPPHPGRVFMALAAAYFETGGDAGERSALEWLERHAPAPRISAAGFSPRVAAGSTRPAETYVPVNDKLSPAGGAGMRGRQSRSFPTVRPHDDKVFLIWDDDPPEDIRASLKRLCSKVTRIGHSSSLVQLWLHDHPDSVKPTLTPDDSAPGRRLRIPEPGTLAYLESAFAQGERPRLPRWQGYSEPRGASASPPLEGVFDPNLIVLAKSEGRVLGLESTLQLTRALRSAAMKSALNRQPTEWLSGHEPGGGPSQKPHAAFFPLPFVGARHADGHILGLAVAIPKHVAQDEARQAIGALLFHPDSGADRSIHLWRSDPSWEWQLRRELRDQPPTALAVATWTGPSRKWASVTPVVLHHYPKKKDREEDVVRIVGEAFATAGLPVPIAVRIRPASELEGAPHALAMPPFTEGGESLCRFQTHVVAEFAQEVRGPVLVGRGRYRGYGLLRPLKEPSHA